MVQKIWKNHDLICNVLEIWEAMTFMHLLLRHIYNGLCFLTLLILGLKTW